jgi:uncharacterized protein with FMN-binding domain
LNKHPIRHVLLATAATVSGVVLLLSLKSNAPLAPPEGAVGAPQSPPSASAPTAGAPDPAAPPAEGDEAPEAQGGAERTVKGETVQTNYGPVQVEITISSYGRITKASAVQAPSSSPRSKEITSTAVPQLNRQAVEAQNAEVDAVSGATFTSQGYANSLQSALDQAGG